MYISLTGEMINIKI